MKYLRENWFKVLISVLFCIFIVIFSVRSSQNNNKDFEKKISFVQNNISLSDKITCTYSQILNSNYFNGEITHSLPKLEINPLIFTFTRSNDSEVAQLSYIDSTQSITNVPVIKIFEDEDKLIYLDGNGSNYLSTHTIYKKEGVATFTKSVDIFGIPSGSLSIGSCVGY